MIILLIDVNYKNSSTGKIVHDLACLLNSSNHIAKVLFGRGDAIVSNDVFRTSMPLEVYFHALMTRVTGLTGMFSYFSTRNIIRQIEKINPDVVHLHELHGYYVNISTIVNYLKNNNIPTVWTFHCEFMYTGKCGYAYECENWKTECHNCPQLKEYPASLCFDFTKFMFRQKKQYMSDFKLLKIITPSSWLASRVRQSFLSTKEVEVIHNGIDTKNIFFPRNTDDLRKKHNFHGKKIILAVAPNIMEERKGGGWVLELARKFDENHVFVLIGVVGNVENLPKNVICIKKTTNQKELADYYSAADLFVICSKRENFPTTCLESLSCGTPIIGFDEGGTAETAPENYGHFVPYGNIQLMSEAIGKFFGGTLVLKSSIECRKFAVDNYDKEVMFEKYHQIYKDLKVNASNAEFS